MTLRNTVPWWLCAALSVIYAGCGSDSPTEADAETGPDGSDATTADAGTDGQSDVDGSDPRCGDGIVDTFEACDDGNNVTEAECPYGVAFCDVCSADCSESLFREGNTCGDGVRDAANEVCDRDDLGGATCADVAPGSVEGAPRCAFDCAEVLPGSCRLPLCGDGRVEGDERCDDGNTVTEDACEAGTETCTRCSADCTTALELIGPFCGDGNVDPGETCDDGNDVTEEQCAYGVASCEVCSADCSDVLLRTGGFCGDALVTDGEVCDSGGVAVPDTCPFGTASCEFCAPDCAARVTRAGSTCGDGAIDATFEQCDGANLAGATCESLDVGFVGGTLACTSDCTALDTTGCEGRPCGNGRLDEGEVCDDGNVETESACPWGLGTCERCSSDCDEVLTLVGPYCGDAIRNGPEVCDGGDGAAASCAYGEALCEICNELCTGRVAVAGPYCGDGNVDAEELCDDGADNGTPGRCSPWNCRGTVEQIAPPAEFVGADEWGWRPLMNDRWFVVAQPFEEVDGESGMGSIYVFAREDGGFRFVQRIRPPVGGSFTGFAVDVHLVDDEILTACRDCNGRRGGLLSYRFDGTEWRLAQTVSAPLADRMNLGGIAAFSDDRAVLIAEYFAIGDYIGIPWLFERAPDGTWGEPVRLVGSEPAIYPSCGALIHGDTVIVGSCDWNERRGALLVFEPTPAGWAETAILEPGDVEGAWPSTLSNFGRSMAFVGDDVLVAGIDALERPDGTGWMVAWRRDGSDWLPMDAPRVDEAGTPQGVGGVLLGTSNRLAVSYIRRIDGVGQPEITFFELRDNRWIRQNTVRHSVRPLYSRSETLSVWGDRFLVGSPFGNAFGDRMGVVWIY